MRIAVRFFMRRAYKAFIVACRQPGWGSWRCTQQLSVARGHLAGGCGRKVGLVRLGSL